MIQISRTGIRNLASNDTVYARGVQYYKDNRVVNASWSNTTKQYRMLVKGSYNYSVIVEEQEEDSFDFSCNCPARLKEQGACKHVVAALLFILKYQEHTLNLDSKSPEERKITQILDYFGAQEDTLMVGETFHIDLTISIPSILKGETARALASLRGGNNRYYKIQALKKFLSDIYHHENIIIGKEFKYIYGESAFDASSLELLEYFLQIYEIQEVIDSLHFSKIFTKSQMFITKNMLIKLLGYIGESGFTLELYGKTYTNVHYVKGNPKILYELSLEEDSLTIDYQGKDTVIPLIETGELLLFNGTVYLPNKQFIRNYVPFYNSLGKDKEPLTFKGEQKRAFLENVLPKISETMKIDVPEELKSRYISCDLEAKIYFDKYKNGVKAELKYLYDTYEFNSFEKAASGSYIIVRQKDKEDEIIATLLQLNFVPYKNFYLMKDENNIYEFLSGRVMELETVASLYYSDDFKRIGIRSAGKFKAGIRVNSELDMLELDLAYDEIPKDELKDLFHSFQLKKKYYRLKNGSFIKLDDKNISEVSQIISALNVTNKDLKEDALYLDKRNAVYLEKAFADKDFFLERDLDFTALTEKILNPAVADYKMPEGILTEVRPYQITGFKWLRTLAENDLGGILADDMGIGKTLQAIVYIASIIKKTSKTRKSKKEERACFLIVCPTSLIYNWQDEIENFAPFLTSEVISGTPSDRQKMIESYANVDVLITSYPLIRRDIESYEKIDFHTIFIDEAQFIKNDTSLSSKAVKRLRGKHRFALTGTPIENSLSELWSIFDFIMPNYLNSHTKFVEQYEKPISKEDTEALNDLNRHISPFILRRMKKDVLTELPDKVETKMLTDLSEEQKKVYLSYVDNIRNELQSDIEENGIEKNRIKILAALTRLRQICCHPATFIENYQGGSGKLDLLMELIPDAIANDHRILLFSQFTSMLRIIEKELTALNIPYFYLEGSTPTLVRNQYVKRFNAGEGKVFLISLKAGGTGLNLTGADTVIHYDPWWNPAVEDQATDRAYRIGQVNKVHVLKLITKGTIEEKIYKLQRKKKELSDSVIGTKEVFINTLSKEELEELFMPSLR